MNPNANTPAGTPVVAAPPSIPAEQQEKAPVVAAVPAKVTPLVPAKKPAKKVVAKAKTPAKKVVARKVHKSTAKNLRVVMVKNKAIERCPKCRKNKPVARDFGFRKVKTTRGGKPVIVKRRQSWCRNCRAHS